MNIRVRVDGLWVLGPFHTIFDTVHLFTQISFEKEPQTTLERKERSSLDFFVAQCLEHLTSVWKVVGSIPI